MKLFALFASLALAFQSPTTIQHVNEPTPARFNTALSKPTFTQELIDCQNNCFECAPCSTQFMKGWFDTPDCERHLYQREFKECTTKCQKKVSKKRKATLKKTTQQNSDNNTCSPLTQSEQWQRAKRVQFLTEQCLNASPRKTVLEWTKVWWWDYWPVKKREYSDKFCHQWAEHVQNSLEEL